MQRLLVAAALACSAVRAAAQSPQSFDLSDVGTSVRWRVAGRTTSLVDGKDKHALKLSEAPGTGLVWIDGYDFANGTIEVDILGRSQPVQGSFVGVAFRVVDAATYDAVYLRPFNFRATDSTRHAHAVQYVSHPAWPWERLRSEHPGEYERSVVPEPDGDEWFHVRVDVHRPTVSVFVNGMAQPSLVVKELSDRARGSIGLWVGEGSGGYFANLRVTPAPGTGGHGHLTDVACVDVPAGEKRPEFGCFNVGMVTGLHFNQASVYWRLRAFRSRQAADAAKSATGIVVEEAGRVWLSEFGSRTAASRGGEAVAVVGPLQLSAAQSYAAVLSYAVMRPGDKSRVHTHPGPEGWYVLSGAQCLDTPAGAHRARAGGTMTVRPNIPMELNVTGKTLRRAFALVIHDSAQERGTLADWKPSGACSR